MSFLKDGIRLHKSNFASIDQQLQPLLANGDSYRLIIKLYYASVMIPVACKLSVTFALTFPLKI
ncbi:hypothetical protein E7W56_11655 [Cronobacter sakazakii]|uniref:hypothetical protein n=1 Tax=Cronobacter sakazakii TaxID=28141 RepID=UPI001F508FC4|nr:hypothetical protein [Cronobacter sakazakii]EKK7695132.1 hypothetical protein [Cronobacter sakazakii]MCI0215139.1 hypothetical protein [Cronobacter sakazakii]HDK7243208.1 hypothetical protein [Cronobacter sakazakii]